MSVAGFRLETEWSAGSYGLTLHNFSGHAISGFALHVSGPATLEASARFEGGRLGAQLASAAELLPPDGFVLAPGAAWTVTLHGQPPLRHWTDATASAYLALADGSTAPVVVKRPVAAGQGAPRRGVRRQHGESPVGLAVIPWPETVAIEGWRETPAGFSVSAGDSDGAAALASFAELTQELFPAEGMVRPVGEGGLPVWLACVDGHGPEGYRIGFAVEKVQIEASTPTGLLYGLITLGQAWRGARSEPEQFGFPASGQIVDAPALGWRGSHLDVARQFYASAEIGRFVAILAWNKLNRFHWHLSDDEGWRVESTAFPQLTEIAAWRGHGLKVPALLGSGAGPEGGFYSRETVREIVAKAGRLGILVVPEIDVPGHCFALLQALPELRDPDEGGVYQSVQGFANNCLNPAQERTYAVLETIFGELIELFPAKLFHIGADEVPLGAWSGSPLALARLRAIGGEAMAAAHAARRDVITNAHGADAIEGSGAALLQGEFLRRIQNFLTARGCRMGGWEEAAHGAGLDRATSYLVGWRSTEISAALAADGYDIVVSPGQAYYLDMAQSSDWAEPGANWAGVSSLQTCYGFDPAAGWTAAQRQHLLGVQACIWSEPMTDRAVFDRLVFPRLSAIAETGWTRPEGKSLARFSALCGLMPVLYGQFSEQD